MPNVGEVSIMMLTSTVVTIALINEMTLKFMKHTGTSTTAKEILLFVTYVM